MCGIFGWYSYNSNKAVPDPSSLCSALSKSLYHRGPDFQACSFFDRDNNCFTTSDSFSDYNIQSFFGHTRLSIIDLNDSSNQPMFDESGLFSIVFNGEIYNYLELRDELISKGVSFITKSDTEVLLNGYIHWGENILEKINGMFAFVIYDLDRQEIFSARDQFGIKPFFYSIQQGIFIFSSEINSMLEFPQISRTLNSQKAYEYLHFFGASDNDSSTMFKDISQIEPGHYIKISRKTKKIRLVKYWDPNDFSKIKETTYSAAANKVKQLFIRSIRQHLRSDVPLGVTLSGGVDSSAITSVIKHLYPDSEINTFSFIAENEKISEKKWVDIMVEHVDANSTYIDFKDANFIQELNELVRLQGEPFASLNIFAQYKVFQAAKNKGIKVVLDGQGADEIFAGYDYNVGDYLASCVRTLKFKQFFLQVLALKNYPARNKKLIIMKLLFNFIPQFLLPLASAVTNNPIKPKWMDAQWLKVNNIKQNEMISRPEFKNTHYLKHNLISRLKKMGLRRLLRYEDRNSMVFSLESRVPFLYKPLVEYVLSLPEEYLIDDRGVTKSVFRKSMEGIVPDEVLYRKDKIGFQTPEDSWLLKNYQQVSSILESAKDIPVFNYHELSMQWKEMSEKNKIKGDKVWLWISFILWYKEFNVHL